MQLLVHRLLTNNMFGRHLEVTSTNNIIVIGKHTNSWVLINFFFLNT